MNGNFIHYLRQSGNDPLSHLSSIAALPGAGAEHLKHIPHGTTVFAAKYDQGVIIGGDRRASSGYRIHDDTVIKVFPLDDYSAQAFAGAMAVCQSMSGLLKKSFEHTEKIQQQRVSLDGKVQCISGLLMRNMNLIQLGLVSVPIVAGYDHESGLFRIVRFDVLGSHNSVDSYHLEGSGSEHAMGRMSKEYHPGIELSPLLELVCDALHYASTIDPATGGISDRRTPFIMKVTQHGVENIDEQLIRSTCDKVLEQEQRRAHGTA